MYLDKQAVVAERSKTTIFTNSNSEESCLNPGLNPTCAQTPAEVDKWT